MPKFRKKPVVIEAIQFCSTNYAEIIAFIGGSRDSLIATERGKASKIVIKTLEGDHTASIGDWVIRGVKGECYPCKPDIFELTYEQIN